LFIAASSRTGSALTGGCLSLIVGGLLMLIGGGL